MNDEIEITRGSGNPFHDADLPDSDTRLMKADLAADIIAILRRRELTNAVAAQHLGIAEADVSRIRNADLGRFTIDRLVKVLNRLGHSVAVKVSRSASRKVA